MNILAFDTCFDACSVAVKPGSDPAITRRQLMHRGHAEALLPMIADAMAAARLEFSVLDRVAVTHGPGSFTGTRVGMAAALGFQVAHDIPIVTYSSLGLIARATIAFLGGAVAELDGIAIIRDAKRDSVYIEITDPAGHEIVRPAIIPVSAAIQLMRGRRLFAQGNATALVQQAASTADTPLEIATAWPAPPPHGITEPDARFMLDDAAIRPAATEPAPLYLRPPDAKASSTPPLPRAPG